METKPFEHVAAAWFESAAPAAPAPDRHGALPAGAAEAQGCSVFAMLRSAGETAMFASPAGTSVGQAGAGEAGRTLDDAMAELAGFLPAGSVCVVHGANRALAEASAGSSAAFRFLDIADLAPICFPAEPDHSLGALHDSLGLASPCPSDPRSVCESLLALWDTMIERAASLPAPLANACHMLLPAHCAAARRVMAWARDETGRVRAESRAPIEMLFSESPAVRPDRRPEPAGEAIPPAEAAAFLDRDGACAASMPGYETREEQVEMARAVAGAFNSCRHLLVEAGTGVGKSLAYLFPAALWAIRNRAPVVVSTNTRNLQAQLFEKDLPVVRALVGAPLRIAIIKGRGNYLCVRKLLNLVSRARNEVLPAERVGLLSALAWAAGTGSGDINECPALSGPRGRRLAGMVTCPGDECPGFHVCPRARRCFLWKERRKSLAADIVVANHSLVFAEAALGDKSPALPPYSHIVFDEAHNLEEAATRFFSIEASLPRLRILTRRLRHGSGRRVGGLLAALARQTRDGTLGERLRSDGALLQGIESSAESVESLDAAAASFFDVIGLLVPAPSSETVRIRPGDRAGEPWPAIGAAHARLDGALEKAAGLCAGTAEILLGAGEGMLPLHAEFVHDLQSAAEGCRQFAADCRFVMGSSDEDFVFWVESARAADGGARACAAPLEIGGRLREHVYSKLDTAVFCSATLTVRGSTEFLRQRLGIAGDVADRTDELCVGSPFDYPSQCVVGVPMFLPEPDAGSGQYAGELASFLAALLPRTRGRALVLFTSYDMLRRTSAILRRDLASSGIRVLAQGETGSRENLLERFRTEPGTVLLGTHSFWEGVDVVGDALSCLVVARLPFAVFTEPIAEARCEKIRRDGGDPFTAYSLPCAVIKLRQGFGRLIRRRTDRGAVIIADRRVIARRYGSLFRGSLPVPAVGFHSRDQLLDQVESFLAGG